MKYKVFVSRGYPPNFFQRNDDGSPRVDNEHKQYLSIELSEEIVNEFEDGASHIKKALRANGMGRTLLVGRTRSKEQGNSYDLYKDRLLGHQVYNCALSSTTLPYMDRISTVGEILSTNPDTNEPTRIRTSLLTILLELKTEGGLHVFDAIFPSHGVYRGTYHVMGDRANAAAHVAKHPPTWLMFKLIFDLGARDEANIKAFMRMYFDSRQVNLALERGQYDVDSGNYSVDLPQSTTTEDDEEMAEMRTQPWFDLSLVQATVSQGDTAAGIAFNPDGNSVSSMNTAAWMGMKNPVMGLSDTLANLTTTQDSDNDAAMNNTEDDVSTKETEINNTDENEQNEDPTSSSGEGNNSQPVQTANGQTSGSDLNNAGSPQGNLSRAASERSPPGNDTPRI